MSNIILIFLIFLPIAYSNNDWYEGIIYPLPNNPQIKFKKNDPTKEFTLNLKNSMRRCSIELGGIKIIDNPDETKDKNVKKFKIEEFKNEMNAEIKIECNGEKIKGKFKETQIFSGNECNVSVNLIEKNEKSVYFHINDIGYQLDYSHNNKGN
ncbi:hypothetical protein Mgra_00004298 [Meloidogyne graminicola]|uniref:Uncharacterized protein n=1 Tax=Meloidogyne graminicola TaxID=189291 RepID=A0A8S9ZT30_9BILA|nr:hypothetical protein Mgra_00004298 [Meloidogyne graminicola]